MAMLKAVLGERDYEAALRQASRNVRDLWERG